MITPFHAVYFANELTRRGGKGLERISQSLFDASVDLNPHQVEASEKAALLEQKLSKACRNIDAVEDVAEEKRHQSCRSRV